MHWTGRLAALALLAVISGCGGDDHPGGTPTGASATAGPSSVDAGDAGQVLKGAVTPLLDQPVVDFNHTVYSGQALAIQTRGRAFQRAGWESTTSSPKELGSAHAPQGDEVKGRMDVRALDGDLYMRLSTWKQPLAGCWLDTSRGQVPGGQLAMTPGVPGYITILGALRAEDVVGQDGDDVVIAADVPLRVGLQMLTTGVLGLLQLDASQLNGATVPVGVRVSHGTLTDLDLEGTDLVSAVRAAGGDLSPDAEATVSQLRIALSYRPGPQDADQVTAPAGDLVMTNGDVQANRGYH